MKSIQKLSRRLILCASFVVLAVLVPVCSLLAQTVDSFDAGSNYQLGDKGMQGLELPDGRLLVWGGFTSLRGEPRMGMGRFNADGTLDASFQPVIQGDVHVVAVQLDGKILIGGYSYEPGKNGVARLNAYGTWDSTFAAQFDDGAVDSLIVQSDGKIVAGGQFNSVAGQAHANLVRMNPDGTVDPSFAPSVGDQSSKVVSLALQNDGRIVVAGEFTSLCGQARTNLGRLNADGTLDPSLNTPVDGNVKTMVLQSDEAILLGVVVEFKTPGSWPRISVLRILSDGAVETAIQPTAQGEITCLALQVDGKILLGGGMCGFGECGAAFRLNQDGTRDSTFKCPWTGGAGVHSLAL